MRLTYFDEGGISSHEPYVVIAGPLVDGDKQLARVEDHLHGLLEKHIPEADRAGFVFHAKDIWSGGRYFRDKERWPLAKRLAILEDLADIPASFGLPVAFGSAKKDDAELAAQPEKIRDLVLLAIAFWHATSVVEGYLRNEAPDEFTLIIAEDRQKVRAWVKDVQATLQGRSKRKFGCDILERHRATLPFHHIRDTVHFAGKAETPLLQVADVCAFIMRGVCSDHPKVRPLFARLAPAIIDPDIFRPGRQRDGEG